MLMKMNGMMNRIIMIAIHGVKIAKMSKVKMMT